MKGQPWREYKGARYEVRGTRCAVTSEATAHRAPRTCFVLEQEAFEGAGATHVAEPGQGLLLDLPHPLPRDAEQRADFLERHGLLPLETEIQPEDLGLALLEGRQHFLDRLGERVLEDLIVRPGALRVGEVVEQLVVLAGGEGSIEGEVRLRDGQRFGDFILGDIHAFSDLFHGRLAAELLQERGRALADAMQRPGAVERHAHDARLLGERLEDRLADPPHGVGDELDAFGLVELVGRPDQAEVALVDQIREGDALVLVFLGYGDDEPEVGADELVQRLFVAALDALGQRDLFLARDQGILADLAQVLIERSFVERGALRCVQLHGLTLQARTTLANDRTEPVPANIGQPGQRIVRLPVVAEIHDQWPSLDRRGVDEAPVTGIRRVVAVVPQHEIPPGRDDQRTPRVAGRVIIAGHARATEQIVPLPVELRIVHVVARVHTLHVALGEGLAIHAHFPAAHLHGVARDADHALDVVELGILGIGEHDHVAAPRRLEPREPGLGPGNLRAVHRFVHEQEVPREQGSLHAARGDLKRFDQEGLDDDEENDGHADRAQPVVEPTTQSRLALLDRGDGWRRAARARTCPLVPQVLHAFYFTHAARWTQR